MTSLFSSREASTGVHLFLIFNSVSHFVPVSLPNFPSLKGRGQGGILIDVTLDPDPILTLTGDGLEVGHTHQNTGAGGAEVILQCLTGEDIQAAGYMVFKLMKAFYVFPVSLVIV